MEDNLYNGVTMGSYYYIKDKDSEFGFTPVPEEDYTQALLCIAKNKGVKITDKMILKKILKSAKKL